MRALRRVLRALVIAMVGAALPLAAQQRADWELSVGAGAGAPIGDFNDGFDIGWHGLGAVSYAFPNLPLALQVDASYAEFRDATPLDLKQTMFYGTGNILYQFRLSGTVLEPYVIGGGGVYHLDPGGQDAAGMSTRTKFGVNAGAGLSFRALNTGLFLESRFHNVFIGNGEGSTQFNNFSFGARFHM